MWLWVSGQKPRGRQRVTSVSQVVRYRGFVCVVVDGLEPFFSSLLIAVIFSPSFGEL